MASEGSNGTQAVQVSIKNHSQIDKGMAIAGITVGLTAFSLCIFAFNWFTFWVSLIGGILLSTVACFLRKQNSVMVIVSIVCSTTAIIIGLIYYPEVLDPIIAVFKSAAWLLERVKGVWGEWASSLSQLF